MSNIQITEDGLIAGGLAEKEFVNRQARIKGAWDMWDWYVKLRYVQTSRAGNYKILRHPHLGWKKIAYRFNGQGEKQIGALRFEQDIVPSFGKRWFKSKALTDAIETGCGYMSGFTGVGVLLGGEPPKPHQDFLYQKRVHAGMYGPQRRTKK